MAIRKTEIQIDSKKVYTNKSGIILFSQRYSRNGSDELTDSKQYNRWVEYSSRQEAVTSLKNDPNSVFVRILPWLVQDAIEMNFKGYEVHSNLLYLNDLNYGYEIDSLSEEDIRLVINDHLSCDYLSPGM